jgi:hypothetical protein
VGERGLGWGRAKSRWTRPWISSSERGEWSGGAVVFSGYVAMSLTMGSMLRSSSSLTSASSLVAGKKARLSGHFRDISENTNLEKHRVDHQQQGSPSSLGPAQHRSPRDSSPWVCSRLDASQGGYSGIHIPLRELAYSRGRGGMYVSP